MHRIDTSGHVSNLFNPGDPLVPRPPTQVDEHWLNAVQEELVNLIVTGAGITLVKGTNTQLLAAIDKLNTERACGLVVLGATPALVSGTSKNVAGVSNFGAGVGNKLRITLTTALTQAIPVVIVTPCGFGLGAGGTPTSPVFYEACQSTSTTIDIAAFSSAGAQLDVSAISRAFSFSIELP